MKLSRIVDNRFHIVLHKLANEPLPLRTAFKLKGINKIVGEEFDKYEEVRKEALSKYGLKNEDGTLKVDEKNNVQFEEAGIKAYAEELNSLMSMEINLPTVRLSELGDKLKLSLVDLDMLDGLLLED